MLFVMMYKGFQEGEEPTHCFRISGKGKSLLAENIQNHFDILKSLWDLDGKKPGSTIMEELRYRWTVKSMLWIHRDRS